MNYLISISYSLLLDYVCYSSVRLLVFMRDFDLVGLVRCEPSFNINFYICQRKHIFSFLLAISYPK
jgi:hypothetical protein